MLHQAHNALSPDRGGGVWHSTQGCVAWHNGGSQDAEDQQPAGGGRLPLRGRAAAADTPPQLLPAAGRLLQAGTLHAYYRHVMRGPVLAAPCCLEAACQACITLQGTALKMHTQLFPIRARYTHTVKSSTQIQVPCQRQLACAELMTGGSLADAFKRQRAFGTRRSLEIAADCARGMAYLHNKKPSAIVHRDLKPGNLMIAGSHYYRQCAPSVCCTHVCMHACMMQSYLRRLAFCAGLQHDR